MLSKVVGIETIEPAAGKQREGSRAFACNQGAPRPNESIAASSGSARAFRRFLPALLGSILYLLNNLGVIHALIRPPQGYLPLKVQRDSDVAQYLTWVRGMEHGWLLPNYHAPWLTTPGLIVPGLFPVSALHRWLALDPAAALQVFSFLAYISTAYVLAFAYRSFNRSLGQSIWSLLITLSCVPLASVPGVLSLSRGHGIFSTSGGVVEYINTSDGFFHGLGTWPLMTWGTCFQVLSMALLARWCNSREPRFLHWLGTVCMLSALIHPFEVFVTVPIVGLVLLQESGRLVQRIARLGIVLVGAAAGLFPFLLQSLRVPWVREVTNSNRHLVSIMPGPLATMLGLPTILVVVLLLFGFPRNQEPNRLILKTWFVCSFLVFYVPGIPFAMHLLDGLSVCVGLLLLAQVEELRQLQPGFLGTYLPIIVAPIMACLLFPQAAFRLRSWSDGVGEHGSGFYSSLSPTDEAAVVEWLQRNATPDDLVLATEDEAPWVATAPIHSFSSHFVFSLQHARPQDRRLRTSFYDGTLTAVQAQEFLNEFGIRFVVVPNRSPAMSYLSQAMLRVRFVGSSIYELAGSKMKPYDLGGTIGIGTRR